MIAVQELLPASRVAALFGVTVRTLHNWRQVGLLRLIRIRGRVYFAVADLERLAAGERHDEASGVNAYEDKY